MFSRTSQRGRARASKIEVWPAPRKGWIAAERIVGANKEGAEVLDNVFPTSEGARVRRGCTLHATITDAAEQMMAYVSGSQQLLFAADEGAIYDLTTVADAEVVPIPEIEGFTNGSWSYAQFGTSGGEFMWLVNGVNLGLLFDGADFTPVNAAAIRELPYDTLTDAFVAGQVVTGGTSGANATILAIVRTSATAGTLILGAVTSGPFTDNEAITGASDGAALAAGADAERSTLAITNVLTSALSFVWPHKSRLWFVEKDTLSLWYLPSGAISGAATEFSLQGVFQYGGSIVFGGTISGDSGSGLDDRLVAITTEGEVAVYAGTDPSSANTWALEGVYRIGKPLSRHAWFKAGGDLLVCTEDGVISILQALMQDRAALMASAISAPIEDAWQAIIARRGVDYNFTATLWHSQTMLMVGTPTEDSSNPQSFVANTRTGAWARYTGWDIQCSVVHQDRLYFGQTDGRIARAETGGVDFEAPYFATWVPKFSEMNTPDQKMAIAAKIILRTAEPARFRLTGLADYQLRSIGTSGLAVGQAESTWGGGTWGTSIWGGSRNEISQSQWQSISGIGFSLSPAVQFGVGTVSDPTIELASVQLQYEVGNPL